MMRTWTISLVLFALVFLTVAGASANAFTDAQVIRREKEIEVWIQAREDLNSSSVRTESGLVLVWFPNVDEDIRIERIGDGDVVRVVRLRPGAGTSGVVQIYLTKPLTLRADQVRIETVKDKVKVSLIIPDMPAPTPLHVETETEVAPQPAPTAESKIQPSAALGSPKAASSRPFSKARAIHLRPSKPVHIASGTPPHIGWLLLITSLLGLVYLVIRFITHRWKVAVPEADIQVVSVRRLGARHQLMVVRALGEDHLLSIHAGTAQCLASAPSADEDTIEIGSNLRKSRPPLPISPADENEPEVQSAAARLGVDWLNASRNSVEPSTRNSSDPVAGILRLRQRTARG